jgi:hypothetical protein
MKLFDATSSNGHSSKNQLEAQYYIRPRFFDVSWTLDDQEHWSEWEFSICSQCQRPFCFAYESLRELPSLISEIDWIRHGHSSQPSYWTPIPDFGPRQWPHTPFLAIEDQERELLIRHIIERSRQPKLTTETVLSGGWVRTIQYAPVEKPMRAWLPDEITGSKGRGSAMSQYADKLRRLGVYRLAKTRNPKQVMDFLNEHCKTSPYTTLYALRRAIQSVPKDLCAFSLIAHTNIKHGYWPAPFGEYLIQP